MISSTFNGHHACEFCPSDEICMDESRSIHHGLPMHGIIDCKPENGCEIQNVACEQTGVMLHLQLVKTAEEENANAVETHTFLL